MSILARLSSLALGASLALVGVARAQSQEALRMEMLYSMRQNWQQYWPNIPEDTGYVYGSGNSRTFLSNWNYLLSDAPKSWSVVERSRGNFTNGTPVNAQYPIDVYGLQTPKNGRYPVGRGGQCPWYVCVIFQRAGGPSMTWSYSKALGLANQFGWWGNQVQRGDIVFHTGIPHVAMVFEVTHDGFVWLAESNWFNTGASTSNWWVRGARKGPSSEVISMRKVPFSYLSSWRRIPYNQTYRMQ